MIPVAIVPRPTKVLTPQTAHHVVLAIMCALVAVAVAASIYEWFRTGRPTALLLVAGGVVCSLNESLVDLLGHCYFPVDGLMAQRLFEVPVPVWVVLAYSIFFGALVYVNVLVLKFGVSRRLMWCGIVVFWIANTLLEMPILASHLYYGWQPLSVGGFPLAWLTINSLGSFAAAVAYVRAESHLTGWRQVVVPFICFATYMGSWAFSMPYFWAVNSTTSKPVMVAGAVLSIALALLVLDGLIRLGLAARPDRSQLAEASSTPTPLMRETV